MQTADLTVEREACASSTWSRDMAACPTDTFVIMSFLRNGKPVARIQWGATAKRDGYAWQPIPLPLPAEVR